MADTLIERCLTQLRDSYWLQGIRDSFVTDRYIPCGIYFNMDLKSLEEDVGRLVDKAVLELSYAGRMNGAINGVVSFGDGNSTFLTTMLAESYLESRTEKKPASVMKLMTGWQPQEVPAGNYLLFAALLLDQGDGKERNTEAIDLVRANGANPLAICALVDRRRDKKDIGGIPVYSLLDLARYTWNRKEIDPEKNGIDEHLRVI